MMGAYDYGKNTYSGTITIFLIMILSVIVAGIIILRYIEGTNYKKQNYNEMLRKIKEESIPESEPLQRQMTLFLGASNYTWHTQTIQGSTSDYLIDCISNLVDEVLEKNIHSIPAGTKRRSAFLTEDNLVYIDLTSEIVQNNPKGTWAEIISIYSLVNTVMYNLKEVKGVKILVEGKELPMLSGHLNLVYPLVFRKEP
ncbi:MAG: GerMN domain-containing protein [bacterium]